MTSERKEDVGAMRELKPVRRTHTTKMRGWPWVPSLLGEVSEETQGGSRVTPPVIFLDIDGVLNQGRQFLPRGADRRQLRTFVDPNAMLFLNKIVEETGAVVVISSTWRIGKDMFTLQDDMASAGFRGRVVGRTDAVPCVVHAPAKCSEAHRGSEIATWLEEHPSVKSFVIIDDDSDMGPLWPWFVHTNGRVGLTAAGVQLAVKILIHGPDPMDLDIVRQAMIGYYDEHEGLQADGPQGVQDEDVGPGGGVHEGEADGGPQAAADVPGGGQDLDGGVRGGTDGSS